ncbi:hypothetical protein OR1_03319 [Geobacter sp. OR-1]|uniref:hypothetical protein n=1 Tax=Geobacter sp. OR-1 TaxID=1266765 RepID=UPI000541CF09|nr:hypothetical protein [Geobacter sp. OR-1]GAM11011.1 hypothetical protein OR1_03319 [Geobacter sp. OR-1]
MSNKLDRSDTCKYIAAELSLITSTVIIVLLLSAMAKFLNPVVDVSRIHEIIAVPDNNYLKPEPLERILFLTGVFVWPILLFLAYNAAGVVLDRLGLTAVLAEKTDAILKILIGAATALLLWLDLDKTDYYILEKSIADNSPVSWGVIAMLTALSIIIASSERNKVNRFVFNVLSVLVSIAAPAIILGIVVFALYDLNIIAHTSNHVEHLNAVLHAVAQVFNGKELLVDLNHQYGMYPHFLEPVFKVTGLSMLSFTAVMGVMTGVALWLLYRFMREISGNSVIAGYGFSALVYYGYFF